MNRVHNYLVVYYRLLCGMFCGHLFAIIGPEDEVVIACV